MKSKALDAKALTVIMSNDDDDDDFQNPSEAIAITQNMILSSIKNPSRSQPLKPSGGALPPRKKQKSSVTNGKENQRVSKVQLSNCSKAYDLYGERKLARVENRIVSSMTGSTLEDIQRNANKLVEDSRCSDDCDKRKAVKKERRQFSVSSGSEPVEIQSTFVSESCVSTVCDELKPPDEVKGESLCLLASGDLNFAESCHSEELDVKNVSEVVSSLDTEKSSYCSLNLDDSCGNLKLEVQGIDFGKLKGCEDTKCLKAGSVSYYSMSIESRLLESKAKPDKFSFQECSVDFEPGTQLNVLMDLCCGTGESVSSDNLLLETDSFGKESCEFERDGLVQCPLCGTDITHLTEELRQVHTNDCLDKDGTTEIPVSVGALKPGSPRQAADVNPVLDWLRTLGLSKYEEIFIKEEVDWETLQWLTEEDLLNIGVVALGPRKKIVHALSQLRLVNYHGQDADKVISDITNSDNSKMLGSGNKLITEYFQGPAIQGNGFHSLNNARDGIEKSNKNSVCKKVGPRRNSSKGKVRDIPPWCCVPGTPFRVDAFRFLRGDCSHWFLTHFHMDHYQGLTRNFCHGKIYCSSITARLVHMKLGVPWERLQILPLNQKVAVAGINLTFLDANHCPGSVIILFEPPNGKAVLHTGDFRFSAKMASSSVLQSCHIHTLILDTTYCNPQYDFPKQEAVIQFVIDAIQAEAFNPKTLFLIGTYTIGKERLFLEVARLLKKKIYVGAAKLRLLSCLGLPEEDMQWFTANEIESHIHVVPMWTIASFKRMKHISRQYANRFNLIVTFSPTGWSFGKGKKKTTGRRWQQGTIIRYEVPYSEHSSFSELREFVQFISPQHIIPSVNNEGPESADAMIALLMSDPEN